MPVRAAALFARLEEDLVEVQDDGVADELADGADGFIGEGHGAEEVAVREHGA